MKTYKPKHKILNWISNKYVFINNKYSKTLSTNRKVSTLIIMGVLFVFVPGGLSATPLVMKLMIK